MIDRPAPPPSPPSWRLVRRLGLVLTSSLLVIAGCGSDDVARPVESSVSPPTVGGSAPGTTVASTPNESVSLATLPENVPGTGSSPEPSTASSTVPASDSNSGPQPTGSSPDQSTGPAPVPSVVAKPPTSNTPEPPSGGFALDPATPLVVAAVVDLARRLGIATGDVTVVEARAVTWGDSSLGCPQPGMKYLPRVVDGTLVVLGAGGRTYEYHGGSPLQLCEHPKAPAVPSD